MTPIRRLLLCAIVPVVLTVCVVPSAAAAALLPGCGSPGDSALNQYCESTPTAGGPQRPQPGQKTLGQAATPDLLAALHRDLPTAAALRRQGPRLHPLVSLPAPAANRPIAASSGGTGPSVRDLVLVILALTVLGGLGGWTTRRARSTASARRAA